MQSLHVQILHSMTSQQLDAVSSMEDYVESAVVPNLKDVSKCWQPADYLPDPSSPDFLDQVGLISHFHVV